MSMSSSPERPLVKITYASKSKRQRPFADDSEPTNSGDDQSEVKAASKVDAKVSVTAEKPMSSSSTNSKKSLSKGCTPPPASPKSKRTLPSTGQSPSAAMPPPDKFLKAPHSKTSSVTSLSQIPRPQKPTSRASLTNAIPSASAKIAKRPPVSRRKSLEGDDSASIAGSSNTVPRVRRSESERIAYYRNHPHCGDIDIHSAQCTKCGKVVRLGTQQTYAIRPWEKHRSRCDRGDASVEDEDQDEGDDGSTVAPSITQSAVPASRTTETERKAILEGDPRAEEVKEDEVLCKKCHKWVKLTKGTKYALRNWNGHQNRCADVVPSQRVAAAERKLQLVNDPQARSFTTESVDCATCGASIQLSGGFDYDLAEWVKHKATDCANRNNQPSGGGEDSGSPDQATKLPFPSTRSPPSSSSTDGTLIATGSSPSEQVLVQGTKRAREDSEEDEPMEAVEDEDAKSESRPSIRRRTEGYVPDEREAPSPLGWFMLPFTAFIRGFRESLGSTES